MKYLKFFENFKENNINIYYSGDIIRELFVVILYNNKVIGGLYCAKSPQEGEEHFSLFKVGLDKNFRGKGLGLKLYLSAMSLLGNKGLSPHRRNKSNTDSAKKVWIKLNNMNGIQQIELDKKINDNDILDSKYIITDKKLIIHNIKKLSSDAFDINNNINKEAWDIVNNEMDSIFNTELNNI